MGISITVLLSNFALYVYWLKYTQLSIYLQYFLILYCIFQKYFSVFGNIPIIRTIYRIHKSVNIT